VNCCPKPRDVAYNHAPAHKKPGPDNMHVDLLLMQVPDDEKERSTNGDGGDSRSGDHDGVDMANEKRGEKIPFLKSCEKDYSLVPPQERNRSTLNCLEMHMCEITNMYRDY